MGFCRWEGSGLSAQRVALFSTPGLGRSVSAWLQSQRPSSEMVLQHVAIEWKAGEGNRDLWYYSLQLRVNPKLSHTQKCNEHFIKLF